MFVIKNMELNSSWGFLHVFHNFLEIYNLFQDKEIYIFCVQKNVEKVIVLYVDFVVK